MRTWLRQLEDDEPLRGVGWHLGHLPAGPLAAIGVAQALFWRQRTGEGQRVDCPIFNATFAIQSFKSCRAEKDPTPPAAPPKAGFTYCFYKTADGAMTISLLNERHWKRFCEVAGLEELTKDEELDSLAKRFFRAEDLRTILAPIHMQKTTKEWLEICDREGIPAREVNEWWDLLEHPQIWAIGMMLKINHPVAGETTIMGMPMNLSENPGAVRTPAPTLGQHTDQIMDEFGYDHAEIEDLKRAGVLSSGGL